MSGDGRGMDASSRDNRVSRVASIEHSKDSVLLSDRGDLMVIIIKNKEVCELFWTQT
jgi:hypothetical protein